MCGSDLVDETISDEWLNSDESPLAWDDESGEFSAYLPPANGKQWPLRFDGRFWWIGTMMIRSPETRSEVIALCAALKTRRSDR